MVDIRKLVVELIGTFIFVLTIGLVVVGVDAGQWRHRPAGDRLGL